MSTTNNQPTTPVLALPPPDSSNQADEQITKLDLSSGSAQLLDNLGPLVVHEDGSLSRIANWCNLSEHEQQVTMRRICARNKARLEALRAAGKEPRVGL